jgi:NAD(P)H-dependent FMN reductase
LQAFFAADCTEVPGGPYSAGQVGRGIRAASKGVTISGQPPLIQLIVGTTRPGRFADKPLAWLLDRLGPRDDLTVEVVDLRDHPLPPYESPVPPARAGRDYPNEEVARLGRTLDRADGFIILTGEYNHGYPGTLKNALDHVFPELNRKPVAFVGYGNVGGARAIEQLRLVAVEFEMAPLRWAVHILPDVMIAPRQSEETSPELFASLDDRLETLVVDLLWWTVALGAARSSPG